MSAELVGGSRFAQDEAGRFRGVWFAAVVAPGLGGGVAACLLLAGAPGLIAFVVGFVAAPFVVLMRSLSRGMTIERACGLAIIAMLMIVGVLVAAILGLLIYTGGGVHIGN
jgi:hypothetical protein